MFKRLRFGPALVACAALLAAIGIARAVNITGTDSAGKDSIVSVGYIQLSVKDAITAAAGGGQTNAVLLDSAYNRVTVVATANDSVKLPPCVAGATSAGLANTIGLFLWVTNADAADSMNVFPSTGGSINALSANSAYAMAANKTAAFLCSPGGTVWYSVLGG